MNRERLSEMLGEWFEGSKGKMNSVADLILDEIEKSKALSLGSTGPAGAGQSAQQLAEEIASKAWGSVEYGARLTSLRHAVVTEIVAAITPSAPIAAPVRDDGARRHEWCQPGDDATRRWLLKFEDTERGESVFGSEAEAREMFHRADDGGWNCYLFAAAPRVPAPAGDVPGEAQTERVRHVKRGTEYEVLGEATAQTGVVGGRVLGDYDKLIIYRCLETGKLWCRFTDEFRDGRFVTLVPGEAQTQEGGR